MREWSLFKRTGRWHVVTKSSGAIHDTACGLSVRSGCRRVSPVNGITAPPGTELVCHKCQDALREGKRAMPPLRTPQYWLAEVSQHGNPKLIDGPHDSADGANRSAYLIRSMRIGGWDRRFAVARVELSECVPNAEGVNHEAVRTINSMQEGT